MRTELTSPPAVEPVTLAEAKLHARVDIVDDDSLIAGLIVVARMLCETMLRKSFITQTWTMFLDNFPWSGGYYNREIRHGGPTAMWLPSYAGILEVPRPPLLAINSIVYLDQNSNPQTIDPALYSVSRGTPGRFEPVYGKVWPIPQPHIDAVQISFDSGYGPDASNVPENIKLAIKMLVTDWYTKRTPAGQMSDLVPAVLSPSGWGNYV